MAHKIANLWENFVNKFFLFAPTFVVCLTFLPCGLIFGYTICSLVAQRNVNAGLIEYGPMIFGGCTGFVIALIMFLVKLCKGRIIFWHIPILLCAGVSNLLASCFYFATSMGTLLNLDKDVDFVRPVLLSFMTSLANIFFYQKYTKEGNVRNCHNLYFYH